MKKIIVLTFAIALAVVLLAITTQTSQAAPPASGPYNNYGYGHQGGGYGNYGYPHFKRGYYGYNYNYCNYNRCNYQYNSYNSGYYGNRCYKNYDQVYYYSPRRYNSYGYQY